MLSEPLLELKSATISYHGKTILDDINLRIYKGEKIALVGKSGAGKSTLLNAIFDLHPQHAALVPQDDGLVQTLSVYHNVYMGQLAQHGSWYNLLNLLRPFERKVSEVETILKRLQLEEKLFERVGNLSGGQRQRTAVARSLYQGGHVLLADEPISAVDEHQACLVLDALCADFSTMILAMHDINLARRYCDRMIGLQDGGIVFDMPSAELSDADIQQLYQSG